MKELAAPPSRELVPAPGRIPTPTFVGVTAPPAEPHRLSQLEDLLAAYLLKFPPSTRAAYRGDLASWLAFCQHARVEVLRAGIHHADLYLRIIQESGDPRTGRRLSPATVTRRIAAIGGFYRYAMRQRAVAESPFFAIDRPGVDPESHTAGLSRPELRRLITTATADGPRSQALVLLLALNGLRVTEAVSRNIEHLSHDQGHQVLLLTRKGNKRGKTPLTPAVIRALHACTAGRSTGPIFITATGARLDRVAAYRILRRLARHAEIPSWADISPHSLRRGFATAALDAGVPLRDVQDAMGHADPRTTRRYDRNRHNLDRHATYAVASFLADAGSTNETPTG